MELNRENNEVRLCGVLGGAPVWSHSLRGQRFFRFPLEVRRLSGNVDTLNILVRQEQLEQLAPEEKSRLRVTGQLRSYNNRRGTGARLVLSVLGRELNFCDEPDENSVRLCGTLCRAPNLRTTPMGRDICDLMLAVNRPYGRSDYLPCICWGLLARESALWSVGDALCLEGRFQSRPYIKLTESGPEPRVAYEVSAISCQPVYAALG